MKKTAFLILLSLVLTLWAWNLTGFACTNFLITKGASTDGSTMITFAADSHVLYGELYFTPAGLHPEGAMLDVYDWDSGKYLGQIKQVRQTFSVVGNINERQVAIGETTYGGRKELENPKGGIDYGSLMYIALQRAGTAREAIEIMGKMVEEYGYCSSGESFSVSDPNEVWILEMIGKGPEKKGAVWVARRVPDGYVTAHANQARINKFPLNDKKNTLYAKDVISFARKKGYFKGKDKDFSFAAAYAPMDFTGLRICEARVWSFFRRIAPSLKLSPDYAMGVEGAKPMPLWIKPDKKLSLADVFALMRDHYEGTDFDMTAGLDAGPHGTPNRWRPINWTVDGTEYVWERPISTQQSGFTFVSQSRDWLPDPIGGVYWYAVDDTYLCCYVPLYCGIDALPESYTVGSLGKFSWDSAWWVFNFVANYANLRYSDMCPDIQAVQRELEGHLLALQPAVEKTAVELSKTNSELMTRYLTDYCVSHAELVVKRWRELGEYLIRKYNDGYVQDENGRPQERGYSESWLRKVLKERPDQFRLKAKAEDVPESRLVD